MSEMGVRQQSGVGRKRAAENLSGQSRGICRSHESCVLYVVIPRASRCLCRVLKEGSEKRIYPEKLPLTEEHTRVWGHVQAQGERRLRCLLWSSREMLVAWT